MGYWQLNINELNINELNINELNIIVVCINVISHSQETLMDAPNNHEGLINKCCPRFYTRELIQSTAVGTCIQHILNSDTNTKNTILLEFNILSNIIG